MQIFLLTFYTIAILFYLSISGLFFDKLLNKYNILKSISNFVVKGFISNIFFLICIWFIFSIIPLTLCKFKIISFLNFSKFSSVVVPLVLTTSIIIIFLISFYNFIKNWKEFWQKILIHLKTKWKYLIIFALILIASQTSVLMLSQGYTDDWLYVNVASKNYFDGLNHPYLFMGSKTSLSAAIQHFFAIFSINLQTSWYHIFQIKTVQMQLLFNYISYNMVLSLVSYLSLLFLLKKLRISPWFLILGIFYSIGKQNSYIYRLFPQLFYSFSQMVLIILPILIYYLFTKKKSFKEIFIISIIGCILHPYYLVFLTLLIIIKYLAKFKFIYSNITYIIYFLTLFSIYMASYFIFHKFNAQQNTNNVLNDELRYGFLTLNNKSLVFWKYASWIICLIPLITKNKYIKLFGWLLTFSIFVSNSFFIQNEISKILDNLNFIVLRLFEISYFYTLILVLPLILNEKKKAYLKYILVIIISFLIIKPVSQFFKHLKFNNHYNYRQITENNLKLNPDITSIVRNNISSNESVNIYLPFSYQSANDENNKLDGFILFPYVFDQTYKINNDITFGLHTKMYFNSIETNLTNFKNYIVKNKNDKPSKFIAIPNNINDPMQKEEDIKNWNNYLKENNYKLQKTVELNIYSNYTYNIYKKS